MLEGLKVQICSDVEYDNLVAEIYYRGKYVGLISQEHGVDKLAVEFPGLGMDEEMIIRKVDLDWFEKALREAKKELLEE